MVCNIFDVPHHQTRYYSLDYVNPQNESADEREVKGFTNPLYFRFLVRQPYTSETMGIQKKLDAVNEEIFWHNRCCCISRFILGKAIATK
jgi:hypothetical protein